MALLSESFRSESTYKLLMGGSDNILGAKSAFIGWRVPFFRYHSSQSSPSLQVCSATEIRNLGWVAAALGEGRHRREWGSFVALVREFG